MPIILAEEVLDDRAAPAAHTAVVERRTAGGDAFFPIGGTDMVFPGEAIRLVTSNIQNQSVHTPEFIVSDSYGNVVFRGRATAGTLAGIASVDLAAPTLTGVYEVVVHAQSLPFLPFTHVARTSFIVSQDAPEPIEAAPKKGLFGDMEKLLKTGAILVGAVAGLVVVSTLAKSR